MAGEVESAGQPSVACMLMTLARAVATGNEEVLAETIREEFFGRCQARAVDHRATQG